MVLEKSKRFTQLVEHNEWEGETWSFWLQVDGNEDALDELSNLIEEEELQESYELTGVTIYEWELDILISYGNFGYGYMNQHHKVAGALVFTDDFNVDDIYKGGIEDFYKES